MSSFLYRYPNAIPQFYEVPPFPSLYWPFDADPGESKYIDTLTDIWKFTLFWTLITIPIAHLAVALFAVFMQFVSAFHRRRYLRDPRVSAKLSGKDRKLSGENPFRDALRATWVILVVYMVVAGVEALVAGSLVGVVLGAVYNAGYFRMSTWTPFLWGMINMMVLIVSSFRIQGGL